MASIQRERLSLWKYVMAEIHVRTCVMRKPDWKNYFYLMFSQLTFNTLKGPVYVYPLTWRYESVRLLQHPIKFLHNKKEMFKLDIKKHVMIKDRSAFFFNSTLAKIWRNYKRQWYFTSGFTSSVAFHLTISITRGMKFWLSAQYTAYFPKPYLLLHFHIKQFLFCCPHNHKKHMNQKPYFQGFLATKLHSE